ncbi:MAG: dipeptidase, partial [Armatimonadetes bacterium]|nr:dipeptidase [Armatimonadota bacterium]
EVQRAGEWVVARLRAAGIEKVQIMPTGGHPVVYGEWVHAPGKPTILIYGHFDTQPVDPLNLWKRPPFEPHLEDGRVYARGASDDKGNMLVPILAVEALLKSTGALPVNVKFFFEGQEEIGSPQIPAFLEASHKVFASDLVVSADGGQWAEDQPALNIGLRGIAGIQIDVRGASGDLHSGVYGGTIQNPIHALVQILDSMHGPDGKILVEGFYDDVVPLSPQDRQQLAAVPFDEAAYTKQIGVDAIFGEPGYTTHERAWGRPTLEINGIWGGFQGDGLKTVLPNEAHAKVTCRLVTNQEPQKIIELLTAHVKKHTPPGVRVTVKPFAGSARPYLMPAGHPANKIATGVLEEMYGKAPLHIRSGGSVPVVMAFFQYLKAYTLTFAFGLRDEQVHAPNEFFRLSSFEKGQKGYCRLLERLADFAAR